MFALKTKFPSTRRWEKEPKPFKLTEIKKGTQPEEGDGVEGGRAKEKQEEERGRRGKDDMVQSLIKIRK